MEDDYMVMNNSSISVKNLHIEYHEYVRGKFFSLGKTLIHNPLKGISIEINHGERLAVIGRNGSGKSTLLRTMAGLLKPSDGEITTNGRVILLAGVDPGFSNDLTGAQNVKELASVYGVPKEEIESFTRKVKDFTELGDNFERKYGNYSTGMKGKLGFGFISDIKPDILLIDEVFGAGDREFKAKARVRMEELLADAATVVMCTHSLAMAKDICNNCIIIEEGHIVFDGDIDDGITYYKSLKRNLVDWMNFSYKEKVLENDALFFDFEKEFNVTEAIRVVVHDNIEKIFALTKEFEVGEKCSIPINLLPNHLDCKVKLQQYRHEKWYDASDYIMIVNK